MLLSEPVKKVLFLCSGNSARSQMAEGLVNHDFAGRVEASSAGTDPQGLNQNAVRVMDEIGIDISSATSDPVSRYQGGAFDYVVTLCDDAARNCPEFNGGTRRLHMGFPDPALIAGDGAETLAAWRETRDAIRREMQSFFSAELDREAQPGAGAPPAPLARVDARVSRRERWEHFRCRISGFRNKYMVAPGLYAFGDPGPQGDVLVSANYKLSFDALRQELAGLDCWILVLDTRGINVWCAAGKGTFGTDELVRRIAATRLGEVVNHRRLLLPQLGAVGVSAAAVRRRSGFKVSFGPVRARDVRAYMEAGYKKTPAMSTVRFPMKDRLILTPMEILPAMKKFPWFAAAALLLFGARRQGIIFSGAFGGGLPFLLLGLIAVLAGAFVAPVLLPFLPFRSFALKGWIAGMAAVLLTMLLPVSASVRDSRALLVAAILLLPAVSSYIALQFTGSTTYTGMSGVRKELRIAVPVYVAVLAASVILLVLFKLAEWGTL